MLGLIKASSWFYFYDELCYRAIMQIYVFFTSQTGITIKDMAGHFSLHQQPH